MHLALIKYTVLRLGLFVVALIVLYLVGVKGGILLYALAAFISLVLSYLLLGRPRTELATALADKVDHRVQRRHAEATGEAPTGSRGRAASEADAAEDRAAEELDH